MSTRAWFVHLSVILACAFPMPGSAHPLGNFSISQYAALRVAGDSVALRYIIDMAEIPTFQELQETGLAPDAAAAGAGAYAKKKSEMLGAGLKLEVNGQRLSLRAVAAEIIFSPGAGGLPTMKLGATYTAAIPANVSNPWQLSYRDDNFPGRAGWKEVVAASSPDGMILDSSVPQTDRSAQLNNYSADLLDSPPQLLAARVTFAMTDTAAAAAGAGAEAALGIQTGAAAAIPETQKADRQPPGVEITDSGGSAPRSQENRVAGAARLRGNRQAPPKNSFTEIVATKELSPGIIFFALALALALGAFHALEPGHGKTVVAAYLVGARGTAKHALQLGLIVTAAHTAGVYILGGIALYASHYIVPERLYPWLEAVSGVMIAALGTLLFIKRYRGKSAAHSSDDGHSYGYGREHRHHGHDHHVHTHEHHHVHHPHGAATIRELLTLGVGGGIVPCPAALVVLLSAVSLDRTAFGILLIAAFSAGLAAVLVGIGLLMVYARHFMLRFQGDGKWVARWLPLASSAFIVLLGIALTWQALQNTVLT